MQINNPEGFKPSLLIETKGEARVATTCLKQYIKFLGKGFYSDGDPQPRQSRVVIGDTIRKAPPECRRDYTNGLSFNGDKIDPYAISGRRAISLLGEAVSYFIDHDLLKYYKNDFEPSPDHTFESTLDEIQQLASQIPPKK